MKKTVVYFWEVKKKKTIIHKNTKDRVTLKTFYLLQQHD